MVEMAALDGSRQRLDVVVVRLLVFCDFCGESYMRAFTEVARFEETKAVTPGTGARYGRVVPVPDPPGALSAALRDPFDLVILATRKSSLNAQILPWKCP